MKQFCKKVILRIILLTVKIASNSHNGFSQFISKHFGEIKKCESNSEKIPLVLHPPPEPKLVKQKCV